MILCDCDKYVNETWKKVNNMGYMSNEVLYLKYREQNVVSMFQIFFFQKKLIKYQLEIPTPTWIFFLQLGKSFRPCWEEKQIWKKNESDSLREEIVLFQFSKLLKTFRMEMD